MNPYTHLRTLLDDGTQGKISAKLYCVAVRNEPIENWLDFVGVASNFTTSLDALIPLWPYGWFWSVYKDVNGYFVSCSKGDVYFEDITRPTPALAMLDCLLQVLEYEYDRNN